MTNNTDNSTFGFFGDANMRLSLFNSMTSYLRIGFAILLPLFAIIAIPLTFIWENRNKRLFRNPTFWGGLIGCGIGVALNLALLGNIKKNESIYKDNHLELGDPDIASAFPAFGAMVIGITTSISIGTTNVMAFAYNKCRDRLAPPKSYYRGRY